MLPYQVYHQLEEDGPQKLDLPLRDLVLVDISLLSTGVC